MCLQSVREVVETGLEGDLPGNHPGGQVGYLICYVVPDAVVFFGRCLGGRLDLMALFMGWVEIYHLEMVVEGFQYGFPRYARGERGDGCEDGSFGHDKAQDSLSIWVLMPQSVIALMDRDDDG